MMGRASSHSRHSVGKSEGLWHKRNLFKIPACAGMTLLLMLFAIFPTPAYACTNPAGSGGEVVFNDDSNVMQYCDGTNWIAMVGAEQYVPNAVDFDGSTYLRQTSVGGSNVTTVSGSFWFRRDLSNLGAVQTIAHYRNPAGQYFRIRFNTSNELVFDGQENGTGTFTTVLSTNSAITDNAWHHVLFSLDSTNRSLDSLYIDGVDETDSTLATIPAFGGGDQLSIGIFGTTNDPLRGSLADVWIDFGNHIDFSDASNRAKFIDANGDPVNLGANGENPTGTSPEVFLSGDTATWHTNKGTFSGFTENGALTTSVTAPANEPAVPSGLLGYWRFDETSGTTAADSSGNANDATLNNLNFGVNSRAGVVGNALNLTDGPCCGNPAQTTVTASGVLPTPNGQNLSVSAWVYSNSTDGGTFWCVGEDSGNSEFRFFRNGSLYVWDNGEGGAVTYPANEFIYGKWAHVVTTYNGSTVEMFINGQSLDTCGCNTPAVNTFANGDFKLGGCEGAFSDTYDFYTDDVRVYNRVLTQSEINELYAARDGIRYNENYRTPEFFDGNKFVSVRPAFPDVTNGLIGHWKLDETSGTTAADSSGNGNDGTLDSSMDLASDSVPGAIGASFNFDGIDDDVNAGDIFDFGTTQDFSVSAWIQSHDGGFIASKFAAGAQPKWWVGMNQSTGVLDAYIDDNVAPIVNVVTAGAFDDNAWHHVTATYDRDGNLSLYVNGSLEDAADISGVTGTLNSTIPFKIGRGGSSSLFIGNIDDVRVYDRVLNATEIQALYAMGAPVGSSTALPQGCPNVGDVCDDGTIYAGLSPDGNVEMFAAPEDAPTTLSWNNNNGNHVSVATNNTDGDGNTMLLVTTDSDSGAAGFQTHQAAQYCYDLVSNGADDWYLPAVSELELTLINADMDIGHPPSYWSSNQRDTILAERRFRSGPTTIGTGGNNKDQTYNVRCVRKGPAPRCANPYGLEGSIIFNDDNDVLQYCDGARWIGIGKVN